MRLGSTCSRTTAWLAILAMALNALWPLIANAKPAGVESLFEVCTTQGFKSVAGDPAGAPDDSGEKHLQPHCPLCSFGTDKVASVPPSFTQFLEPVVFRIGMLESATVAEPRNALFRFPARPRDPPLQS